MLKTYESRNYIFHFYEGSLAEKQIQEITFEQEKVISDIKNFFSIDLPFKIEYFLLETPEQVGEIYGDNEPINGFAEEPNKIYAVYNDSVKCIGYHEDVHIVSYLINKPASTFIREGLAMYFDKTWWEKLNEEWVREFIQNGQYINIGRLFDNEYFDNIDCSISYPIAGAYTKFLITKYGKDKYLEMYKSNNHSSDLLFQEIYKKNIKELENEFLIE